mgnify:CR=1 FL=1
MQDPSRARLRTDARFELYLSELGDLIGDERRRSLLEDEFRRALGTLVRHRYESAQNLLHGHQGIELVHETLHRILDEGLEDEPGALMRLVSRVGHRLFRNRHRSVLPIEEAGAQAAPQSASIHLTHLSLEREESDLLRILLEQDHETLGNGRVHFTKLARRLGISTKALRKRLRLLLIELGRDRDYQEFWFGRLAEACLELYRVRTESELGDLLGSWQRTQRRLRQVLGRLSSYGAPSSLHPELTFRESRSEGLRILRLWQRKPDIPSDILADAAEKLHADPLAKGLIDAERLRATGHPDAALARLGSWDPRSLPPRRALLLRLARARCLEKSGRTREASDLLEDSLLLSRGDLLFQYNRYVLARLCGHAERAHAARAALAECRDDAHQSPLLLRGIRLALDHGPK